MKQTIEGHNNIQVNGDGSIIYYERPKGTKLKPNKCQLQVYRLLYSGIDSILFISSFLVAITFKFTLSYLFLVFFVVFLIWYLLPIKFSSFFLMTYLPGTHIIVRGVEYRIEDIRKISWNRQNRLFMYFWNTNKPIELKFYSPYHAEYLFDCILSSYSE
jgi:hypothetical protein